MSSDLRMGRLAERRRSGTMGGTVAASAAALLEGQAKGRARRALRDAATAWVGEARPTDILPGSVKQPRAAAPGPVQRKAGIFATICISTSPSVISAVVPTAVQAG